MENHIARRDREGITFGPARCISPAFSSVSKPRFRISIGCYGMAVTLIQQFLARSAVGLGFWPFKSYSAPLSRAKD
jgi:hypothetical protein